MQETKTAPEVLRGAAEHISLNGLLYGDWDSEDGTGDLPPCGCVVGTLRRMAGLPPDPFDEDRVYTNAVLEEAGEALGLQTYPERAALAEERHGPGADPLDILDWSDHHADVEVVSRKGRGNREEMRRLELRDGDRDHVVRVLRYAADRCGS